MHEAKPAKPENLSEKYGQIAKSLLEVVGTL